jgi:hypothetical protein
MERSFGEVQGYGFELVDGWEGDRASYGVGEDTGEDV